MMRYPNVKKGPARGMVLVVVLAFIVLLTGLVMAYFSRSITNRRMSDSSFHHAKVDELAKSAMDIIVGDLRRELVASGTAVTVGTTAIYLNTEAMLMRNGTPALVGGTSPIPTLLRISTTGTLVGVVDHLASNAVSTGTSANGRSITLKRWNKHYLIPRVIGADPSDTTPIEAFAAPNWIYVTGTGGPVTPPLTGPGKAVIGRYAYAVYDESGLLDVNVAGYPFVSGTLAPAGVPDAVKALYARKSYMSFADLTAIGLSGSDVNMLVGWRNYASLRVSGSLGNSFSPFPSDGDAANYQTLVTLNTTGSTAVAPKGFLAVSGTSWNNRTDQVFMSRQQLIAFRNQAGFSADALQYLGTFSRAVTAPSWGPLKNATEIDSQNGLEAFAYKTSADDTSSANRNIPNVRVQSTTVVTHYLDDGTSETYRVQQDDSLIRRRFSLAKLAWLGHSGPDTTRFPQLTAQAVSDCFGVQWNSQKIRWDYTAAKNDKICTLAEVAAQNREPNFFELLKAGILKGSLGGSPGEPAEDINYEPKSGGATSTKWDGPLGTDCKFFSADKDRHVLQIGANIIDQADSDNYPTAIYKLTPNAPTDYTDAVNDLNNTVFGVENLPMLSRLGMIVCYIPNHNNVAYPSMTIPDAGPYGVWLQPEIWNPHESSTAASAPGHLRIVTYGRYTGVTITCKDGVTSPSDPEGVELKSDAGGSYDSSGVICFKNPVPGSTTPPDFFDTPIPLTGGPQATTSDNYSDSTCDSGPKNYYFPATDNSWDRELQKGKNRFLGIWLGQANGTVPGPTGHCQIDAMDSLTFALQYYDGKNWLPYCVVPRLIDVRNTAFSQSTAYGFPRPRGAMAQPDPRTNRFSATAASNGFNNGYGWMWGRSIRAGTDLNVASDNTSGDLGGAEHGAPRVADGFIRPASPKNSGVMWLLDQWARNVVTAAKELPNDNCYYKDPDGVVRPGDSWNQDYASGNGMMTYHKVDPVGGATLKSATARRPVILNRPFASVGELGYVFRDQPFKTLDFWTDKSADGALLDLFSIIDEPVVAAGKINPNNAAPQVLRALLSGAMKMESNSKYNVGVNGDATGNNEAETIAQVVWDYLAVNPVGNRAELATALGSVMLTGFSNSSADTGKSDTYLANMCNKTFAEAPMRALSSVSNFRTWNLMVDVIAQTGSFLPGAPATEAALNRSFTVQGERRYWLHVAIDRFTGQVVDQQLEPVYE